MAHRILLTGFGPFPGVPVNPTGLLMARIASGKVPFPDAEISTLTLDTVYARAHAMLEEALRRLQPHALISFGVAVGETTYRLERLAVNWTEAATPDAEGVLRPKGPITAGPAEYRSSLPLAEMEAAIAAAGIPVRLSDSAGRYVCNHAYYCALHHLAAAAPATPAGFIHVPGPGDAPFWQDGTYMRTLERVAQVAVETVNTALDAAAQEKP
jgi:pyroglutamyl-peptidase